MKKVICLAFSVRRVRVFISVVFERFANFFSLSAGLSFFSFFTCVLEIKLILL